jgi:hypothetical protein
MSIIIEQNCQSGCPDVSVAVQSDIGNWLSSGETFRIVISDDNAIPTVLSSGFVDTIRRFVTSLNGQYIHIDANDLAGETLAKRMYAIMTEILAKRPYRIQLPIILQHNPHSASPFIDRAIVWQRLCDMILEDDVPQRLTILVIENLETASQNIQHELARLIRLHKNNRINRTFLITLNNNNTKLLLPELCELAKIV